MKTYLIIDDNQIIREILSPMLELWAEEKEIKITIIKKENGAEALSWVKQHGQPSLTLLDVRMPVMDGAEFLRQVALLGMNFRSRTLLLTGYADDLEEHLGSNALLMKHLRKPFKANELFAALEYFI